MRRTFLVLSLTALVFPTLALAKTQSAFDHLIVLLEQNTETPIELSGSFVAAPTVANTIGSTALRVNVAMDPRQRLGNYFTTSNVQGTVQYGATGDDQVLGGKIDFHLLRRVLYGRFTDLTVELDDQTSIFAAIGTALEDVWIKYPVSKSDETQIATTVHSELVRELKRMVMVRQTKRADGGMQFDLTLTPRFLRTLRRDAVFQRAKVQAQGKMIFDAQGVFTTFVFTLDIRGAKGRGDFLTPRSTTSGTFDISLRIDAQKLSRALSTREPMGAISMKEVEKRIENAYKTLDQVSPSQQLKNARDAQRRSDVNTILNAVYQYAIDHNGEFPDDLPLEEVAICMPNEATCDGVVLDALLETYLITLPRDPLSPQGSVTTGYTIQRSTGSRITIRAPKPEGGKEISVTR